MSEQSSDDLLVSRVATGDEDAFARLFEKYATYVRVVAHRTCYDRADAEDVTQEVFAQLWQRASQFDAGRSSRIGWPLWRDPGPSITFGGDPACDARRRRIRSRLRATIL